MRASRRGTAGILLGLVLLISPIESQDFGAAAPPNCWVTQGGSFSRCGTAATTAVTDHLDRRWSWKQETPGEIEGDPLVWQGLGLIVVREPKGMRHLVLLDLLDGTKLGDQPFKTDLPLAPSLWANFVVVRAAPDRLEAWQLSGRRLARFEFFKLLLAKQTLSAPLFTGHDVYVRANSDLLRLAFSDADRPLWRTKVDGAKGELSIRGDYVFVGADGDPGARIVAVRTRDGSLAGHTAALPGATLSDRSWPEILDRHAILFGLSLNNGHGAVMFPRDDTSPGGLTTDEPKRFAAADEACAIAWNRGFIVPVMDSIRGEILLGWSRGDLIAPAPVKFDVKMLEEGDRTAPTSTVLADAQSHPDFVVRKTALARAGSAIATGGGVFDLGTSKILHTWTSDGRPIPVRGGWLTTRRGGEITLWRATQSAGATPAPTTRREVTQGRVLLINGMIIPAPFALAPAGVEVTHPAKRTIAWADILAVEDRANTKDDVAFMSSLDAAAEARAIAVEAEAASDLAKLARSALDFAGKETLAAVIDAANTLGADDGPTSDVAAVQRALRNWHVHPVDEERSKSVAAEAESRRTAPAANLAALAKASVAERADLASALLRQAFARDPHNAAADAALRALIPAGIAPPPRDARDYAPTEWIDLAAGLRRTGGRVIPVPTLDGDVTPEQRILGSVRESLWATTPAIKQSLFGLHVGDVALITRAARPRNVGRCVTASVEVCSVLEKLFATDKPRRKQRDPLEVRYYSSQREFLSVTGAEFARMSGRMVRDLTPEQEKQFERAVAQQVKAEFSSVAGVYFPSLSRATFFEPDTDDPLQPVEQVFRHELTHAWLDLRNPRRAKDVTPERSRNNLTNQGQWCVEGFPTFLQEQAVDARSAALTENPSSFTLDFIAHAGTLLPWPAVLGLPRARELEGKLYETWRRDLYQTALDAQWTELPNARLKTYLGVQIVFEPIQVFYRQAAAACHYLYFAEGGKMRAKLLDFITDYYNGEDPERLDFQTAFGIDPEDFGQRVVTYAKKAVGR